MPAAIEQATRVLKDNHFKITKQRTAMIEFLVGTATNRFVDVTSIDEFMRKTFPNLPTLELLKDKFKVTGLRLSFSVTSNKNIITTLFVVTVVRSSNSRTAH